MSEKQEDADIKKVIESINEICEKNPGTGVAFVAFKGDATATGLTGSLNLHATLHGVDVLMHHVMRVCNEKNPKALKDFSDENEKSKIVDAIGNISFHEGSHPLGEILEAISTSNNGQSKEMGIRIGQDMVLDIGKLMSNHKKLTHDS
jgi:hypothetical protein